MSGFSEAAVCYLRLYGAVYIYDGGVYVLASKRAQAVRLIRTERHYAARPRGFARASL